MKLHTFDLKLRHEFRISREAHSVQPTLIVELIEDGRHGYGEATSNAYYGMTVAAMASELGKHRDHIENCRWERPEDLWQEMAPRLGDHPFCLCALDLAAHDLWGKRQGRAVHELWGLRLDRLPPSNYTIGIDAPEVMVAKLEEMPGWPVYKIKLGTPQDLAIVRELRRHTTATFRVDANCGWDVATTLALAPQLRELGVEFIEQPLPADRRQDYERLYRESALPIMADESCITETDVPGCQGHFHGINIKLVKCGGMTPARRMIAQARELGLKVMVGCMTESSVGISAIAQLLPLLDYVDMDGAVLLAEDIAEGVRVERGVCHYPEVPGNGVTILCQNPIPA